MRSAGSFLKKDMKHRDARSRQLPGALVISGVLPGEPRPEWGDCPAWSMVRKPKHNETLTPARRPM
jgi:hypothetical protein